MDKENLELVLLSHKKWLNNEAGGVRADLQGANLQGADMRDADMRDANLRGACLRDANLRGACLRDADLQDADLRDACLHHVGLQGAYLKGADLREANLDFSCLPLRCGGLNMKLSNRTASQLIYHAFKQDFTGCTPDFQKEIENLLNNPEFLAFINTFTSFRDDLKPI